MNDLELDWRERNVTKESCSSYMSVNMCFANKSHPSVQPRILLSILDL